MKPSISILLATLLLPIGNTLLRASDLGELIEARTRLHAIKVDTPRFPLRMLNAGVTSGKTEIIVAIAPDGSIEDHFVVASTHEDFSVATTEAVKRWVFAPDPNIEEPGIHVIHLKLRFQTDGVLAVVTRPSDDTVNADRYRVAPCAVAQLDAPLQVQTSTMPAIPLSVDGHPMSGSVVISYYIDQTGAVRVPTVDARQAPELASAAAQALKSWKFNPPTADGKPVYVQVRQRFRFGNS